MLLSDLKHDFIRSRVERMDQLDVAALNKVVKEMADEGAHLLARERIPKEQQRFEVMLDMRYVKQYHEVSCAVTPESIAEGQLDQLVQSFHEEHNRLYGYSLEAEGTPVELINVRLCAVGVTDKPRFETERAADPDASSALKNQRNIYVPEHEAFEEVKVYDGHALKHGMQIEGPALIEQVNTTVLITASFDTFCDAMGSFVVHRKGIDLTKGEGSR
jgi:N-methylhydantoinase A